MALHNLRIFLLAQHINSRVTTQVLSWTYLHQQTLGKQILRSADSITNNISEGYARVRTGERLQLLWYAEGSIQETKNGIRRCVQRRILDEKAGNELETQLTRLSISLIEFMHAILMKDPEYIGPYRRKVEERRAWRGKRREESKEEYRIKNTESR
jgi:four helix bundle protein